MAKNSREVWAKRVERWKDSGLTASEFASEIGVNAHTLAHWSWKLRRLQAEDAFERPNRRPGGSTSKKSSFHKAPETTATAAKLEFVDVSSMLGDADSRFEIEVRGLRLFVPPHFETEALRRLIGVLEQAR